VKRSAFLKVLAFLFLGLFQAVDLHAQQLATLNVKVTDQSGAGIPLARVLLKTSATGVTRSATSDAAGLAVLAGLPPGSHELTVEAAEFGPSRSALTLSVGQIASLSVVLSVTTLKEQVEVRETAQGIDAQTPEVSQVIETEKIADLPIAGRDFIDFVLLTPNVNVGRSTAVGAQSPFQETVLELSFAGLRETHSTFFGLDGTDYTTSISGV
jgi:hypothetical protein